MDCSKRDANMSLDDGAEEESREARTFAISDISAERYCCVMDLRQSDVVVVDVVPADSEGVGGVVDLGLGVDGLDAGVFRPGECDMIDAFVYVL